MTENIASILQNNHTFVEYQKKNLFNSIQDVESFLKEIDFNKNPTIRIISWCIQLEIISSDFTKCFDELEQLNLQYQELIKQKIPENTQYLTLLKHSEADTLHHDIERTILWYEFLAKSQNFEIIDLEKVHFRAGRILSLLSLEAGFGYTQGYDRYVFITFLESQILCQNNNICDDFAEALSYFLSQKLLSIAKCHRFLDDLNTAQTFFKHYDELAELYTPNIQHELTELHQGSLFYALRWLIVLFADEFTFKEILVVWDNIILNHKKFDEYMEALFLSRMLQIEAKGDKNLMPAERIQRFKDLDIVEFIINANKLFNPPSIDWQTIGISAMGFVSIFVVGYFVYNYHLFQL